jgi:SH3 domain-containing YSC84-like protein 1
VRFARAEDPMSDMLRRSPFLFAGGLLVAALPTLALAADSKAELDERARRAAVVFQEMRNAPDREIPLDLLSRARCAAIIPNVIKAAWVVGGRYGKGLLSCRSAKSGEWSAPVFVMMTGGSFGLQIGASSTDVLLFFMTYESVKSVLNNKVKLSGDAGVAAGPLGREAEAATDAALKAQILSYARSRGLFAGVSVAGAYLGVNYEDTRNFYGKSWTPGEILFERKVSTVPKAGWDFLAALPRPAKQAASKNTKSKGKTAKAPARPAAKATAKAPAAPAPSAAASGEASGFAGAAAGEASGTAAAGPASNETWGEASGTAAAPAAPAGNAQWGEASGTAAAPAEPAAPVAPVR